jgi:hypothetical protein
MDGGFEADGELVEAGGDGPVALEPVDAAFDGVALLVAFGPSIASGGPVSAGRSSHDGAT